jgi:putative transposase
VEQNVQIDHIHTVMIIPPKYAVSGVIGQLKQATASGLREKFPFICKVYRGEAMVWSPGYFVSTVGIDEDKIIKYVRWQQSQDSGQTKFEDF